MHSPTTTQRVSVKLTVPSVQVRFWRSSDVVQQPSNSHAVQLAAGVASAVAGAGPPESAVLGSDEGDGSLSSFPWKSAFLGTGRRFTSPHGWRHPSRR